MKPVFSLLTIALLAGALATTAAAKIILIPTGTNSPIPRYVTLWNEHDLSGWRTFSTNTDASFANSWSTKNGILSLTGKPLGYLRTERTFTNYRLHVEWRWISTNGNSGVFVHLNGADAIWPRSVECQLKSGSAGELVGQGGVDFPAPVINGKKRAKITTPSEKPVGEWNNYDIYCRGKTIEVQVNGVRQNLIETVSVDSGAIGIQLEGHPVEFRKIWVELL